MHPFIITIDRCCRAKENRLETCTNPFHSNGAERSADGFCPFPPSVSIADQYNGPPTGPLDNINVLVAEHLLRKSSEVDVFDFNLRFQVSSVITVLLVNSQQTFDSGCATHSS